MTGNVGGPLAVTVTPAGLDSGSFLPIQAVSPLSIPAGFELSDDLATDTPSLRASRSPQHFRGGDDGSAEEFLRTRDGSAPRGE